MSSEGSVSQLLARYRAGDAAAAQKLWERYFRRLVGLARKRLEGFPGRMADEEDVALSAFNSFFHGAEKGRFEVNHRESLWALLVTITARKATKLRLHEGRQKRRGGAAAEPLGLEQLLDKEPTPAFAAEVTEECRRLFGLLPDADFRSLAQLRMEGFTDKEIAAKLDWPLRTVQRRLKIIRSLWAQEEPVPDRPSSRRGGNA